MAHLFRSAAKGIAGADASDHPTSAADGKSNGLLLSLGMGLGPEGLRARGSQPRLHALKLCIGQPRRLASPRILSDGFSRMARVFMTALSTIDTRHKRDLAGRVALVTGASRGIGRAVALELARAGAHVIALARTQGALEELDDEIRAAGSEATLVPCDAKDFPALDRLGAAIYERWKKLDIFIGNAGILGPVTPLAHVDPKQWDDVFAVNVTANWRLIRSLDVLLRTADAGRLVLISSGAGHKEKFNPYWGPYAASKAALDGIVRTYAAETVNVSSVKVMAANPGPLRTRLRAQAMPGEDPQTLRTPEDFAPKVLDMCRPEWRHTGMVYDFPSDCVLAFQAPRKP
jgi:NAD(P)-dependent dehydrogenase (short-subunit alcohol dehydrogenase family)